ncbi:MAG: sugar phosphate nucleotidyltransferase [Dehalococcoidia bacterium]|nr:sugar phosphate nucleotidyltransferase [Dehalococcoidia bacterium]
MKAVILIGGEGTRIRPLSRILHKAMLPVLNRPLMEFVPKEDHPPQLDIMPLLLALSLLRT